jgi:hypothetical protein
VVDHGQYLIRIKGLIDTSISPGIHGLLNEGIAPSRGYENYMGMGPPFSDLGK